MTQVPQRGDLGIGNGRMTLHKVVDLLLKHLSNGFTQMAEYGTLLLEVIHLTLVLAGLEMTKDLHYKKQ